MINHRHKHLRSPPVKLQAKFYHSNNSSSSSNRTQRTSHHLLLLQRLLHLWRVQGNILSWRVTRSTSAQQQHKRTSACWTSNLKVSVRYSRQLMWHWFSLRWSRNNSMDTQRWFRMLMSIASLKISCWAARKVNHRKKNGCYSRVYLGRARIYCLSINASIFWIHGIRTWRLISLRNTSKLSLLRRSNWSRW